MVSYDFDVGNLCSDFQEDIIFKFSFGWTALVTKFIAPRNPRLAILLGAAVCFYCFSFYNDVILLLINSVF